MRGLSRLAAPLTAALGRLRRWATYTIIGDDMLTIALLTMDVREIRRVEELATKDDSPHQSK